MNKQTPSAVRCLPLTSQISGKPQTTPGAGQSTANNTLSRNNCGLLWQNRNSGWSSCSLQCLRKPPGCSLLPPFPRPCSGWPGASVSPRCGGRTSSCPSWSSLWSWAGVSPPRSEALKKTKEEVAVMRRQAVIPGCSQNHRIAGKNPSKIIKPHRYPRAAGSTTKPCPWSATSTCSLHTNSGQDLEDATGVSVHRLRRSKIMEKPLSTWPAYTHTHTSLQGAFFFPFGKQYRRTMGSKNYFTNYSPDVEV